MGISGESYTQDALRTIAQGSDCEGTLVQTVTAQLVPEPENPHDKNAIRVDVGGMKVGYVPKTGAAPWRKRVKSIGSPNGPILCRAQLSGGWQRPDGDEGSIGVELVVGKKPRIFTDADAFLPNDPWEMPESVQLLDGVRSILEGVLAMSGNAASCSCVVHLAPVDNGALAVALNGEWVGHIVGRPLMRQLVDKVAAAGLPTNANARLNASSYTPTAELIVQALDPDFVSDRRTSTGARSFAEMRATPTGLWGCLRCHNVWEDGGPLPVGWPTNDDQDGPHVCPACGTYRRTRPL